MNKCDWELKFPKNRIFLGLYPYSTVEAGFLLTPGEKTKIRRGRDCKWVRQRGRVFGNKPRTILRSRKEKDYEKPPHIQRRERKILEIKMRPTVQAMREWQKMYPAEEAMAIKIPDLKDRAYVDTDFDGEAAK